VHNRRKTFDIAAYRKRRKVDWQRRMAGFEGLIIKAVKGDREPLIDYFRYRGPFHLSEDDGELLAWLLERRLPRAAHRPRGSSTPTNKALQAASYLFRRGKCVWCEKHGRHRVSDKAIVGNLAKRALELVEQEIPSIRGKITANAVRDFNKSIREDDAKGLLGDFLAEAMWEIKKAALK
jgi:hypothetical protein